MRVEKEMKEWTPLPTGGLNPEVTRYPYQFKIGEEVCPHKTFKSVLNDCLTKWSGAQG